MLESQGVTSSSSSDLPTDVVPCCKAAPAHSKGAQSAREGQWDDVFYLPNVAIHTHVLPNGKVLFWGRRDRPDGSMNEHECTRYVWDPEARTFFQTPQPMLSNEQTKVNLFCSGHAFLPDGRLLVAGGHLEDMHGDNQACVYDYRSNDWTALPPMNNGRWYPSALALSDGSILVASGTFFDGIRDTPQNNIPQIFDGQAWHSLVPPEDEGGATLLSLYPRWHLLPAGRVVVAGTNAQGLYLEPAQAGTWTPAPSRTMLARDYAPSVMYDVGKVVYIGGGNDPDAAALRLTPSRLSISRRLSLAGAKRHQCISVAGITMGHCSQMERYWLPVEHKERASMI